MLEHIQPGKPHLRANEQVELAFEPLLSAAAAGKPLEPVMTSIVQSFGFDTFVYAVTTTPRPTRESRVYTWTTLPREWVAMYDRNAYAEIDPRVTETWGRSAPFVWDAATISGGKRVQDFLHHAGRYGIRSGVSTSFIDSLHQRIGVGFNSAISPVSASRRKAIAEQLGMLMVFGAQFHDVFMANVVNRGLPPSSRGSPLSSRELECLQLAAHGMTSADIGVKLGIAERTANFHFANILSKLDALNRHEAIARGMDLGLIHMTL